MDSAGLRERAVAAVSAARKAGADQAEAYVEFARLFRCRVREGKTDLIKQATTRGLGLRVFVGGRPAFVNSSDLRAESLGKLAEKAVSLARIGERDELAGLPEAATGLVDTAGLDVFDAELTGMDTEKKIDLALRTESAARDFDPRVTSVEGTSFSDIMATVILANSNGVEKSFDSTQASLFTRALCNDKDGKQQSGGYSSSQRFLKDLETPTKVGREAAGLAVEMLGPVKITTRKAPVLMHSDVASEWISNLAGAFSGEQIFKKSSWLADKMGQSVGSSLITIIDDGLRQRGTGTVPFDGEGVATRRNVLLDKGVVTTFLYDTYNARKSKTQSTGSATRGYESVPTIGTRNLYVENGVTPIEELLATFDALFYMKDQGAFGYNPTTGDYSYQASGLWIEKGTVTNAVSEVTVASNSLMMLQKIVKVGNDLRFEGSINAPHLLIEEMTISGA